MDRKKKVLIIGIMTIIFTIMGSTLAYWNWQTSESQRTNVVFTVTGNFSCAVDGGGNITSNDLILIPTTVSDTTTGNYIKREVKAKPTITKSGKIIYMDLWLDINDIGTGLSNSVNFKYALTTISTSPTSEIVSSGNFNGKMAGDKINLLTSKEYTTTTTDTYYLWIWLDAKETSSDTMDQTFSLSLNGSCMDYPQASKPEITDGMIPVVISSNGVTSTVLENDASWYNYNNKEWANAVLVKESGINTREYYQNNIGVTIPEEDILAYYVYIPRYKYKIWTTSLSSAGKEQEIEIVFENKDIPKSTGEAVGEYLTHPAFTFGSEELNGIWVGKFETGGTATAPLVKPDISSLRSQNVSQEFTTSQIFGTSTYGMTNKVDAHMMKNSEWGAVAYLSHSRYGVNREVYINNSRGYYTGRSGGNVGGSTAINTVYPEQTSTTKYNTYGFYTWNGYLLEYDTNTKSSTHDITKVASTTGNITGVYDMSGGAYEYVMGVLADSSGNPRSGNTTTNNSGFNGMLADGSMYTLGINFPDSKYYDLYTTTYALTACNGGICYGHGLSEVSNWYGDYADFVFASYPWFVRGGYSSDDVGAGAFSFYFVNGTAFSSGAARSVLSVGRSS